MCIMNPQHETFKNQRHPTRMDNFITWLTAKQIQRWKGAGHCPVPVTSEVGSFSPEQWLFLIWRQLSILAGLLPFLGWIYENPIWNTALNVILSNYKIVLSLLKVSFSSYSLWYFWDYLLVWKEQCIPSAYFFCYSLIFKALSWTFCLVLNKFHANF